VSLTSISDLRTPSGAQAFALGVARLVSERYDAFVEGEEEEDNRAPGIHASEIHGCARRAVYSMLGTKKKKNLPKNWRQRFMMGHKLHDLVQQDFHRMAMLSKGLMTFESEVKVSPRHQQIAYELDLHSSCDGVFTFRDEANAAPYLRMGLEIKTESPAMYDKITEPKEAHVEQAHIYMKALDLPLMYFMYINKGNQNNTASVEPYLITYDEEVWARLEARCRTLMGLAMQGTLPPKEPSLPCEFCPYAWTCEPGWKSKKNYGVTHNTMRL